MAIDERTDSELVRECLEGREYAYAELVRRYQDSVFGLAVSMTRNREDAEDMAQEAFIRAYSKLDQYNPDLAFRPWILRICSNRTKNLFRSRVNRRTVEEKHLNEETVIQDAMDPDFQAVEDALGTLPAKLGAPLRLKYMEGLSYEEISTVLGIGVSAAKMRVMRARKQLQEVLT